MDTRRPGAGCSRRSARLAIGATIFEHKSEYYAAHRDLADPTSATLVRYDDWSSIAIQARTALRDANVPIVPSYCQNGLAACQLVLDMPHALEVFYELDTP
jgi:hypothetical protein